MGKDERLEEFVVSCASYLTHQVASISIVILQKYLQSRKNPK